MFNDRVSSRPTSPTNPLPKAKPSETPAAEAPRPTPSPTPSLAQDRGHVAGGGPQSRMALPTVSAVTPSAADDGPDPLDARDFGNYLEDQGDTNGCGTTSLGMMLSFMKGEPGAFTRTKVDEKIRFGPDAMAFTSPANIEGYAKSQGFRSKASNDGTMDQLQGYLDKGAPVQVLYDPNNDGGDTLLHYVNVVGYTAGADGKPESFKIADPAGGTLKTVPADEFAERWGNLEMKGVGTGLNNVMIVTLPGENTPLRDRDGNTVMSDDIDLPENGMGVSGFVADLVSDTVNSLNPVQNIKNAWNAIF